MTSPPFDVTVFTLFPEAFPGALGVSILARAAREERWKLNTVNIREHSWLPHRGVDDTPAGGGAGLVMRADVLAAAIDSVPENGRPLIYMSPRGKTFDQGKARELAATPGLRILCGRFEGVDERLIEGRNIEEISLGDYILAGGEVAAQSMIEATVRLLPGVAGNQASLEDESFESGLLEYPQYTKPAIWENREIPAVLTSGHHGKVKEWRNQRSKELTQTRRKDLWAAYQKITSSPRPEPKP